MRYIESDDAKERIKVWFARELQTILGYARWENFLVAVHRAVASCKSQGINVDDHFREVTKMVGLGSGAKREVADFMLTRYACYLIAQNGYPKKEEIAFAQSYFAVQTRKAELIEERLNLLSRLETRDKLRAAEKQLSQNIYEFTRKFVFEQIGHVDENLIEYRSAATNAQLSAIKSLSGKTGKFPAERVSDWVNASKHAVNYLKNAQQIASKTHSKLSQKHTIPFVSPEKQANFAHKTKVFVMRWIGINKMAELIRVLFGRNTKGRTFTVILK